MAKEKWKPVMYPVEEFGKFPWDKVACEGLATHLNIRFIPAVKHGVMRHVDIPREAHIQFFLDEPWINEENGGSFRPFEVWFVPWGLSMMVDEIEMESKDELRRGIKDLLKIRDIR